MITIKMYKGKWRILIGNEIWEFATLFMMKIALDKILDIKDTYGRLERHDI